LCSSIPEEEDEEECKSEAITISKLKKEIKKLK
jgi:hypothetical protein